MLPPYLWGRPPVYCSAACERRYRAIRAHMVAQGLVVPPPPRRVVRKVIGVWVTRTVVVNGVAYDVVWHGAVEGHWSDQKGGLLLCP